MLPGAALRQKCGYDMMNKSVECIKIIRTFNGTKNSEKFKISGLRNMILYRKSYLKQEDLLMNKITKTAVGTSVASLILLGIVILSGVSYPAHLFTYGTGTGLIFLFVSIFLFVVGWGRDFSAAVKQQNKYGVLTLVGAAILVILPVLVKYCLN